MIAFFGVLSNTDRASNLVKGVGHVPCFRIADSPDNVSALLGLCLLD